MTTMCVVPQAVLRKMEWEVSAAKGMLLEEYETLTAYASKLRRKMDRLSITVNPVAR